MGNIPPIVLLGMVSSIVPFGIGYYHRASANKSMKLLWALIGLNIVTELMIYSLAIRSINTLFIVHTYTLIAYVIIVILFSSWQQSRMVKWMHFLIGVFVAVFIILHVSGVEKIDSMNVISLSYLAITVMILSLYTLFNMMIIPSHRPIYADERFWICAGLFIAYGPNVSAYPGFPHDIAVAMASLNSILSIVSNIFYGISFFCLSK